ncbi:hypothetical protein GWI33_021216 [Rhynchophorus ferrugineus]|uniref:Uncharacterized protein n=1 Tax=Rhynchophorus ferrugineus TaxID=354439 RepID=A0A834HQ36_RHYFE|nr:hypothetical protein GWI33_021216 [Rhynchophorus ferrugineus]
MAMATNSVLVAFKKTLPDHKLRKLLRIFRAAIRPSYGEPSSNTNPMSRRHRVAQIPIEIHHLKIKSSGSQLMSEKKTETIAGRPHRKKDDKSRSSSPSALPFDGHENSLGPIEPFSPFGLRAPSDFALCARVRPTAPDASQNKS